MDWLKELLDRLFKRQKPVTVPVRRNEEVQNDPYLDSLLQQKRDFNSKNR
jgi:hypothetical protein